MKTKNFLNQVNESLNLINGADVKVIQTAKDGQAVCTIISTVKAPEVDKVKEFEQHLSIEIENDLIIFNYRENEKKQRFTVKKSFLIKIAKAIYSIVDCFENIHRYIKLEVFDPKSNTFKKI